MPSENYANIHVLAVDDDEINREIAARYLTRKLGFINSAEADDGSTALAYMESHPDTDIIFLDRMMPMNGLEFFRRIKDNPAYQDKIIILQTGKVLPDDLAEVLESGIIHVLRKPYDDKRLAQFLYPLAEEVRVKRELKKALGSGSADAAPDKVHTLEEAQNAAPLLAKLAKEPAKVVDAIYQLLANGLEHGVLGLSQEIKAELHQEGSYRETIDARLRQAAKPVTIKTTSDNGETKITISDLGKGFNPTPHFTITPEKLLTPFGKHLLLAARIFKDIKYSDEGRTVTVIL